MPLHHDNAVDRAMRANFGAGFHYWDPDTMRFHKSRPVAGVLSSDGRFAFVIERYRTAYLGTVCVQTPHSRVVRVNLATGETDYLTADGKPTSEMVGDHYVNNGERHAYRTNAQAIKAARRFAGDES